VQSRLIDARDESGATQGARIVANFHKRDERGEHARAERVARTIAKRTAFVSPPQGKIACEGMDVAQGWETKGKDFNVCLARETIKINTSNYQAVLNFLAATIAAFRLSPPIAHPPPTLRKFLLRQTAGRISSHSRAFTLPWIPQLYGTFVNVKRENPPPLKAHERR